MSRTTKGGGVPRPRFKIALHERIRDGQAVMRALCHEVVASPELPGLWRELQASERRLLSFRRGERALEGVYAAEDAAFHEPGTDMAGCSWCRRQAVGLAAALPLPRFTDNQAA